MKKLLLASTALAMSAGVAAADVSLSGDARMGLVYDGADVRLTSRARVMFTMSGETDGGLSFGASFRANDATPAAGNEAMTAGSVFISGDFGTLSMGDVASAGRRATGDLYGVGLTGLGDLNDMTYLDRISTFRGIPNIGNVINPTLPERRTAALYNYSVDGFNIWVGIGQNQIVRDGTHSFTSSNSGAARGLARGQLLSIGASYTFDGFTVAAGHENFSARNNSNFADIFGTKSRFTAAHTTISAEYAMDGFKGKVIYGVAGGDLGRVLRNTSGLRNNQIGASVEGSFDAVTVTAFAARGFDNITRGGLGVAYDLGGGAKFQAGISQAGTNKTLGITRARTRADLGLAFTF